MADPKLEEAFRRAFNREASQSEPTESMGAWETFGRSLAWSPLALLGVDPPPNLARGQAENPVAGFAGEAAGYLIPYLGWFRLSRSISPIAKTIARVSSAEKMAEAPFKTGFAREFVRYAPFEVGRVGAAAISGEEIAEAFNTSYRGTGEVALQAGTDLLLGSALGGTFDALSAAGSRYLRNRQPLPGADLRAPRQIQLRQISENLQKGLVADKEAAIAAQERLSFQIRSHKPKGGKYVFEFEDSKAPVVNRLFKEGETPGLLRTRIRQGVGQFRTREDVKRIFARAGIMDEYPEAWMEHPRYLQAKNSDSRRIIKNVLSKQLTALDSSNNLFYKRDKESGLFVMAKKISNDEWLLFKTDTPGHFAPEHQAFKEVAEARAGIFSNERPTAQPLGEGADVFDAGVRYDASVPAIDPRGLDPRKGRVSDLTARLMARFAGDSAASQGSAIAQGAQNFIKAYVTPGMFQFDNPIAARAFNMSKHILDAAEATAERLFIGLKALSEKKGSIYREILRGAKPVGADDNIQALIAAAARDKDQWTAVWKTIMTNSSIEDGVRNYGLGDVGVKLLRALEAVDEWQLKGLNKTLEATGRNVIAPMKHHYMLSRTWEGNWRVPIYEGNRMIGVIAAKHKGTAQDRTARFLATHKDRGLRAGQPALAGELEQDLKYLRSISPDQAKLFGKLQEEAFFGGKGPKRLREDRAGVGGFIGESRPWTREEFENLVLKQLRDYQRFQAKISTEHLLKSDLTKLSVEAPDVHEQLTHRIRSMYGEPGKLSSVIDEAADKVLSPYLGKNSASKIVGTANKWMFRWTLGFLNTGYNIANSLAFIQTAYPQIAFLTSAAPSRIAQYYTYYPVLGKQVGTVGMLDMWKITKRTFQTMRKPDDLLWKHFNRGAQDGVWDPKFVEEWVGQKAEKLSSIRGVLMGEEPFSNWFSAVADSLPSLTEKFARGQAFTMGHVFFREIMGITDDEMLYQLTKQFVEKTQFLYSTGDRARIITGPLGSAFGLFKNWIMHYIGWMAEYTGEAVLRGNWRPLLWMMGGTTAIGGVAAVPFFGVADSMSKWMSDKSIMQHTYSMFNEQVADTVFYGFPAFLGFSIQNQVSAPFADPGQDAARMFSMVYLDRARYLGKVFEQATGYFDATGRNPIRDQKTRDLLMRALAPKTLYRTAQVVEGETLKSMSTGYPVTTLTPGERLLYAMSANPLWAEKAFRVADELWDDQNKMREAVQAYGTAWAEALQARDSGALRNILLRASYEGVDVSSVIKSGNARMEKAQEDLINRQFSAQAVIEYRRAGLVR